MANAERKVTQSSGSEIIRDLLENDVYNFSQINAILALYPDVWAWYVFIDRDNLVYKKGFAERVMEKFQDLRGLTSSPSLRAFFRLKWGFLAQEFFDWVDRYRFVPEYIKMWQDKEGHLKGKVLGPWVDTLPDEQIIMAIVSQTRNEEEGFLPDDNWLDKVLEYIYDLREAELKVSEFGMRRRAYNWMQDQVTELLTKEGGDMYVGSSSPYHAQMSGLSPKGTVGHQWTMFHSALHGVEQANQTALIAWRAVYGDNLGTALTDTYTSDFFWATLTPGMAQMLKSYRQDSGDPYQWTDRSLRALRSNKLHVEPRSVTAMYTDALDNVSAKKLDLYAKQYFQTAYGMGGFWTNNKNYFLKTPAYKPLNIIVKPFAFSFDQCESWEKVVKRPDSTGKSTGDRNVLARVEAAIARHPFPY
jgi:nicotinate phosphoribosyltransferase